MVETPAPAIEIPGKMRLRLGAYFIDGSLASLVAIAIWYALTTAGYLQTGESEALDRLQNNLLYKGVLLGYMVFAQAFYHTTIGKYIFGLEIASMLNDCKRIANRRQRNSSAPCRNATPLERACCRSPSSRGTPGQRCKKGPGLC
jgi:hypothetical protein